MARLKLSDRLIQALEFDSSDPVIWDKDFSGGAFGVRLSPGGTKTFVLKYRTRGGRQRWLSIGRYPSLSLASARDFALKAAAAVVDGRDPAEEKLSKRQAATFGDLWIEYLERHAKVKKRSWRGDQYIAERDLLPAWKHRKLDEISRLDVVRMLDTIKDRGAGTGANRTRALISKIFMFAIGRGLRETNPAYAVPRPHKEVPRDRVLTRDEIKTLWQAIGTLPMLTAAEYKLRLLTAARGKEIRMMKWSDVENDAWVIPAENAKNGHRTTVFLSKQAMAVLDEVRAISGDGMYVFPGKDHTDYVKVSRRPLDTLRRDTTIDFRPHDLRRTAAHCMAEHLNIRQSVISSILNHVAADVTAKHYTHAEFAEQKRHAMALWGNYVQAIVDGEPVDNIVPFAHAL